MSLTLNHVVAAGKAAADDAGRYAIVGVKVNGMAEATDGRIAVRVTPTNASDPLPDRILDRRSIDAAERLTSKRGLSRQLATGADGDVCALTDEGGFTLRKMEGEFPDFAAIWPKDEPKFTITLNPAALQKLLDVVKVLNTSQEFVALKFEFTDAKNPVRITSEIADAKLDALVMPIMPA